MSRIVKVGIPVVAGLWASQSHAVVRNESKRNFYEDDANVVPKPGSVVPAAGTEVQAVGTSTVVDGTSVRSARFLERVFRSVRQELEDVYLTLRSKGDEAYSSLNSAERQVTSTVSGLHARQEDLFPNSVYILIAGLAGNIAARKHGVVAKVTLPVLFGTVAFRYFLPQTFANTTHYLWEVEQRNFPEVAAKSSELAKHTHELVDDVEKGAEHSKQFVNDTVAGLRRKVADVTGLHIDEVSKK
ncbi:hypothetical protein DIURU_004780 [Diutina rugosa]|uniref:MICOS complex subunit n=1 Tax=Diutina rugosa TaxID=5481 RepID=A0A642UHK8_DIURU|nr:uncharacterized protein DIURU_004780 [Diutina rugosa]KAA8897927.1 hypothetical protein DIURU_004780 [Diutina rugosa]